MGIAILVDYLYITFSDSRTAEVTMAVSVAFWIILKCSVEKEKCQKSLAGVAAAVVFAGERL